MTTKSPRQKSRLTREHNAHSISNTQRPHTSMGFSRAKSPVLQSFPKPRPSKTRKKTAWISDKPSSNSAFLMTNSRTRLARAEFSAKNPSQNDTSNNNVRARPFSSQSNSRELPFHVNKQEEVRNFKGRKQRPKSSRSQEASETVSQKTDGQNQDVATWKASIRNQEDVDALRAHTDANLISRFDSTLRRRYQAKPLVDGSLCTIVDLEDETDPEEEEQEEINSFTLLKLSEEDNGEFYETDLEEDFPANLLVFGKHCRSDYYQEIATREKVATRFLGLKQELVEPPPEEYDPSGKNLYVKLCFMEGLVPVSYLFELMAKAELVMKHHGLGPHGSKPLAEALKKNTCVQKLDLTDNGLEAVGGIFMATMLYENFYITDLDLSDNFLGAEAGVALARVLLSNQSLQRLTLKGNHLTDKVAKAFAESLKENRTLTYLDLSYNEFGELGGLYLGAGLALNYGLQVLNLKWNGITRKGAVSIAAALKTNDSLSLLNLSWNGLSFIGALALTRHLKKNEVLTDLDISNNRISPKGAQRLSLTLAVHPALRSFKIGLNPIGEEGVTAILNATRKNPNIKYLGLEDITVSPKVHHEILILQDVRDIMIVTGGKAGHTQEKPPPSGMEILIQFIQDNRLRLKDLFFQFDKDHSGDISKEEFKTGLKETGIEMSNKQLDALTDSIDIDGNNKIDYSEILYGREAVLKERRFQRKVAIRTEQREKESIQLPKLKGFEE